MDIMKKLKDVLSETELKSFEKATQNLVTEQVALRVEEETKKLETKGEEFCKIKIEEGVNEATEKLILEYDKKLEDLEEVVVERLDKFLDLEISEQISDDVLKKIAINEVLQPVVTGIQDIFENQFVALDCDGQKVIEETKQELQELRNEHSKKIAENMELAELAEKAACDNLILKKTSHLTESDQERVKNFCKGQSFDDVSSKIDSFISVVESDDSNSDVSKEENKDLTEDITTGDKDFIKETQESKADENKDISEDEEVEKSLVDQQIDSANKYM